MYVYILSQGQKAVFIIVDFDLVIYSFPNFNYYQHYPFAVNFVLKIGYFAAT